MGGAAGKQYLLFRDVEWSIEDNPCGRFLTGWRSSRTLVRDVMFRLRKQQFETQPGN